MNHKVHKIIRINSDVSPLDVRTTVKQAAIPSLTSRSVEIQLTLLDLVLLVLTHILIAATVKQFSPSANPYTAMILVFNVVMALGFSACFHYYDLKNGRYSLGKAILLGFSLWLMSIPVIAFRSAETTTLLVTLSISALVLGLFTLISGTLHYAYSKPFWCNKQDHFYHRLELLIKRIVDFMASLMGLVLITPMITLLLLVLLLEGQGSPLISQIRIGRGENRFRMYKLRSMIQNADTMVAHNQKVLFKQKNDPRITPLGRIIRQLSMDELPQLINVLKGEMSLVGPRPPLENEFELMNWSHKRKFKVTPGLTGLWQITGRIKNHRDFNVVGAYDAHYIENWCLMEDFRILLQTIPVVVFQKGAV